MRREGLAPRMLLRVLATLLHLQFVLASEGSHELRMVGVDGPMAASLEDEVQLLCLYELGTDGIYSMKWYKDDVELFRYVPSDTADFKAFPIDHIRINKTESRPNKLMFKPLSPLASGTYRCEITVETPSFVTRHHEHNLTIIVPPKTAPSISGLAERYRAGDLVEVSCVAADSKPAATLRWRINGNKVPKGFLLPGSRELNASTGLETAYAGLRFTAGEWQFEDGEMRLRCVAEMGGGWRTHAEVAAVFDSEENNSKRNADYTEKMVDATFANAITLSKHTSLIPGFIMLVLLVVLEL